MDAWETEPVSLKVVALLGPEYHLIQDSQDIEAVLDSIGHSRELGLWGMLFVKLDASGADYSEVWASTSSVPRLSAIVRKL